MQHIESRLKGLETNEDIASTIANLLNYSNGSLHDTALVYRNHDNGLSGIKLTW